MRGAQRHNKAAALKAFSQGLYSVTPTGIIYTHSRGKTKKLSIQQTSAGYERASLRVDQKGYQLMAHVLVWLFWCGDYPDGLEIDHLDGNKQNNNIDNLELVSIHENDRRARINKQYLYEHMHPKSKLTPYVRQLLQFDYDSHKFKMSELCAKYQLSRSTIWRAVAGRLYEERRVN